MQDCVDSAHQGPVQPSTRKGHGPADNGGAIRAIMTEKMPIMSAIVHRIDTRQECLLGRSCLFPEPGCTTEGAFIIDVKILLYGIERAGT